MLKFIRGPRTSETVKFMSSDSPILIGRNFDCHVQIASDESISRYQSQIDYVDDKWVLRDGYKGTFNKDKILPRNQNGSHVLNSK